MADHLDITGEVCPMTFVRIKLKLQSMRPGEALSVRLREGEPLANVPRALRQEGHEIVALRAEGNGIHRLDIRKNPKPAAP
ncbi:MAG: sulfurtransferase TusA family protein [Reyranellaceae bacterium]